MTKNIKEYVIERINSGAYPGGARLNSERDLAKDFQIPRSQVRKALMELVSEGYLESRRGSGYSVRTHLTIKKQSPRLAYLYYSANKGSLLDSNSDFGVLALRAAARGMTVAPVLYGGEDPDFDTAIKTVIKNGNDAIIIQPVWSLDYRAGLLHALDGHFPVVCRDFCQIPGGVPTIGPNHFDTGFKAAKILSSRGYSKPLYIGYAPAAEPNSALLRHEGFTLGCKHFSMEISGELLISAPDDFSNIRDKIRDALGKFSPDCVFASTKVFTMHAVSALFQNCGLPLGTGLLGSDVASIDFPFHLKIDSLATDKTLYADKTLEMIEEIIGNRYLKLTVSLAVSPEYIEGDTLRFKGEKACVT